MQLSSLATQFIFEGRDHCDLAATGLLDLEKHSYDPEVINGIFRSFHTLKGTSGIFPEYAAITTLTHAAEDLMDLIRNGEKTIDAGMTDLFLAVLDQVGRWLDVIESTGAVPVGARDESSELLAALKEMKNEPDSGCVLDLEPVTEVPNTNSLEPILRTWLSGLDASRKELLSSTFQSSETMLTAFCYTPVPDAFFFGDDPISLIHAISGLMLLDVVKLSDAQFDDNYDPFVCDLRFLAVAVADCDSVREIFAYVEDQTALLPFALELLETEPAPLPPPDLPPLEEGVSSLTHRRRAGDREVVAAEPEQATAADSTGKKTTYIRVDQQQINALMDLVGEMIIAKNSLPYLGKRAATVYGVPALADEIDLQHGTINYIVSGLQEIALGMRMLPVSRAFERLSLIHI